MTKVYLVIYSYRWSYADYGTSIMGAYKDAHSAETVANRLNEGVWYCHKSYEEYYVEELAVQ